jgi:hypothetical protein
MEINCGDWNSIDKENTKLSTILYADDRMLTAKYDELQIAANHSNKIAKIYNMKYLKQKQQEIVEIIF